MTCLEHYFENLLLHGKDVANNVNRNALTEDEREAVEYCAKYVVYVLFGNRKNFERWLKEEEDNTPTIDAVQVVRCKDCKYSYTEELKISSQQGYLENRHIRFCKCELPTLRVVADIHFCSCGERKENE